MEEGIYSMFDLDTTCLFLDLWILALE
jgi:hypothetical protein